jgi:hypothetical protein
VSSVEDGSRQTERNEHLGSDVAELADETEDSVLAPPEGTVVGDTSVLLSLLKVVARDLGELGEEEEDTDGCTEAGDGEVNVLNRGELDRVGVLEEGVRSDSRSDERSETVEGLGEVEAEGSALRGTEDRDVGAKAVRVVSSWRGGTGKGRRRKERKPGRRENEKRRTWR